MSLHGTIVSGRLRSVLCPWGVNFPNELVTNIDVAVDNNESLLIGDDINKMGATPSYYEAVKICNGSLHSPRINTMSEDIFRENRMVRAFI